jgi:hypothetical protein
MDLARLAAREGAHGLLEAVALGGTVGLVALEAMPAADDAWVALPELCALLVLRPVEPVLRSVHAVVAEPPRPREPMGNQDGRVCALSLERVARDDKTDAVRRDLALSALALLAEHGVLTQRHVSGSGTETQP